MRWEEGVGGHMGRVGGDGDGRGMRKGAQDGEKSEVYMCIIDCYDYG